MMLFYLGIALLSLIAAGILLLPVLSRRPALYLETTQLSVVLYKQKLAHLEQEKSQGEISEEVYHQTRAELEKSLLTETGADLHAKKIPQKFNISFVLVLPLVFIVAALVVYAILGSSRGLPDYLLAQKHQAQTEAEIKKLGSVEAVIDRLRTQLAKKPDSRGWYLLGRLYMKNQQLPEAIQAFTRAEQLQAGQPEILVSHAEALYLANHNALNPQAKVLLQQALTIQPGQLDASNLLAIDAYQQQDYARAIAYWERLLPQFAPQSPAAQNILQMIAAAQQKIGHRAAAKIKLRIQVSLQPGYKKQLSGNEALFIYAQAVKGPAMPLAVVRHSAKDLPLTVILDETMAMVPNMTLANVDQVWIKARISKSGQALPSPGDLEGTSAIINPQHPPSSITVVINRKSSD